MDTLLCNDDGDIVIGTYDPSNTLLRLSADQYTAGSATWADQSGNGLDFTVSTNASLKGTDADGFPYMNFSGSYGYAQRLVGGVLTNIPAPTTGKYMIFCVTQLRNTTSGYRTLTHGATQDNQIVIQTGTNNLGLYDSSGVGFRDSGFDVTTDMKSTRNLLVWELSTTAPIYKFQLNESGTDSIITDVIAGHTLPFASIGMWNYSPTEYWGNIYEFIVYDGVLSASERDYVAEYLAYKWDISSKLPSLTSTHGVITNEETLAFLYAGSGTETTYTWDAEGVTYADILVVGGGGGSSNSGNNTNPVGGAGGGEVVFRQGVAVTPGVEIKVGRGGPISTNGGISQFTSAIRANGGARSGASGGSGGGAGRGGTGGASVKLSLDGMGNAGGNGTTYGAGGGGGATEPGSSTGGDAGQNGGEGYAANVFGVWNTVYGSGGGSGERNPSSGTGFGGLGGTNAGNGGASDGTPAAQPGVPHTGGGAGGAGAYGTSRPGAPGGSGIVLVKPNPGALDGLGTTIYTQAVGAYALRRLFGAYTGAQVRLRRSTDDEETNVTFDKYGYLVDFDLTTWIGAATAYVTTWYDQSGEDNDLTQTNVTYQPKYDSRNKRVNLNNAYMTIPGSDNVAPFSTNQPTLVQRTSMVSFKAPSNLASNNGKNVYAKGLATSSRHSDTRVWWYQAGNKLGSQHGSGLGTDPEGAYTSEEVVVYSIVEENSSSSVNATSHVLRQNGVRQSDSVVSSSRTFDTDPNNYPWGIGYGNGGSSQWNVDAYINEHIIFNTTLNDSVRVAVENEMQYHAIKNGPGVIPPLPLALQ